MDGSVSTACEAGSAEAVAAPDLRADPDWPDADLLRLVRLAADLAGTPGAALCLCEPSLGPARVVSHGLPAEHGPATSWLQNYTEIGTVCGDHVGIGWSYAVPLEWDATAAGALVVFGPATRPELTAMQREPLTEIANLVISHLRRDAQHTRLVQITERALRADRMLQMVAEAPTCAEALTGLLTELCRHHQALVGRIWQLELPTESMHEVSRYNGDALDAQSYYRRPPTAPINARNLIVAEAIRSNEPRAVEYAAILNPERFVLLHNALEAGLQSQVSYPVWVQDQRFGISLAFRTVPDDLSAIVNDIDSLANTIRPALLRKVTEERFRHVAHHDDLTQLSNRLVFQDRLAAAVAAAELGEQGLALLSLDLDGFKAVNDHRGHEVGDKLLSAVAARIRDSVRASDTVARVGGDEFAIVQTLEGQPVSATSLAERLIKRISVPYEIGPHRLTVGVSIGVAIYPAGGGVTPDVLLRHADIALYRAKAAGRNTSRVFHPEMDQAHQDRALIERDLTDAVTGNRFGLAFQPICDIDTLAVRGFEALLRWDHPTRGPIEPAHFVSLAEQSGLILPLGQWALEAACTEAARWDPLVRLSVNLSPLQFRQAGLPEFVAETLRRTGLAPDRLDLEVTEGLLLDDSGLVLSTMRALKEQGIGITLDDFGTAYASLSYLRRFPFDRIKIDKSFVQGMCRDDGTLAIVQAIVALGARLDLSLVAEGVETETELLMLRKLGGLAVQGFLTGPPMTAHQARALLDVRTHTIPSPEPVQTAPAK